MHHYKKIINPLKGLLRLDHTVTKIILKVFNHRRNCSNIHLIFSKITEVLNTKLFTDFYKVRSCALKGGSEA